MHNVITNEGFTSPYKACGLDDFAKLKYYFQNRIAPSKCVIISSLSVISMCITLSKMFLSYRSTLLQY